MRCRLEQVVLGEHPVIDLDERSFCQLRDAMKGAFFALAMEEKLKIVVDNHIEFEEALLNMALRTAAYSTADWSSAVDRIHTANRRLSNLLSSVYMYIEHARRGLRATFGRESDEAAGFKEVTEDEKRTSPMFSFVLDLRHYVQHQGLAISALSLAADREGGGERYRYIPFIDTGDLRIMDRERTRPLPAALDPFITKDSRSNLDVRPVVREAVAALARIHKAAVGRYEEKVKGWETAIRDALSCYCAAGGNVAGLEARSLNDDGSVVESFAVMEDPIERRHALHARVIFYQYAKEIYVTNAVDEQLA